MFYHCARCEEQLVGNEKQPLGHDYGDPTITFTADGKSARATWQCLRDESHFAERDCVVNWEVVSPATYDVPGTTKYTAVADFEDLPYGSSVLELQDVPVLEYPFGAAVIAFSEDGKSATAVWTSKTDPNAVVELSGPAVASVERPGTCTEMGVTKYTVTFDADANLGLPAAVAETFRADIPATWHNYEDHVCVDCGHLYGDVNSNGSITIVDAQIAYDVANNIYSQHELCEVLQHHSDVTGPEGISDGTVDAQDAFAIMVRLLRGAWGLAS